MVMMMVVVMLMSILEIIVVIILAGPRSRVVCLEFLAEFVRQLSDHLRRMLLLLLRGPLLQPMMKSVHAVRLRKLGLLRMVIVVMVMVMMLQRMMRRDAQKNRIVVIPRWRPVL